ncbi:MAG TPA: transaldolase family protein [Planctomycetota bacterium]|nr:transaldolase family protein [Planctomycetota bacterium]
MSYFHRVHAKTATRLWVNNPTVADAERAIVHGARAATTNPTYASKILATLPEDERGALIVAATRSGDADAAVDALQRELVGRILPVFARFHGGIHPLDGLVSIQGNPHRDTDRDAILHEAARYEPLGANVIFKIPATRGGLEAIEDLLRRGKPVLATEMMSVAQTHAACAVYRRVMNATGHRPILILTHITGIYDQYLGEVATRHAPDVPTEQVAAAGLLVARRVRAAIDQQSLPIALMGGGARRDRHFTDMVGGDLQVTINPDMIERLVEADQPPTPTFWAASDSALIARLRDRLPDFRRAWDDDGLAPGEFEAFGPVRLFLSLFIAGWDAVRAQCAPRRHAAR